MNYQHIKGPLGKVSEELLTKFGLLGEDLTTLTFLAEAIDPKLKNYKMIDIYVSKIIPEETAPLDSHPENKSLRESYIVYAVASRRDNSKIRKPDSERRDFYLRRFELNNEELVNTDIYKNLARESVKRVNRVSLKNLESILTKLVSQ